MLIVTILIMSTLPVYTQAQQPNMAKLKADAQKVVSIISGDKAKTRASAGRSARLMRIKITRKAEALSRKVSELEKKLGPEYVALNSPEGADISSILEPLDDSCPDE